VASPSANLASSLEQLKVLQDAGRVAVRAKDLSRIHRDRLKRAGFLREVMKGWYVPTRPDEPAGESTAWYAAFWRFAAQYLESRFPVSWCLSAEQSIRIHVGDYTVPSQLLVRSPRGGNKPTPLPHGTSVFDLRLELPPAKDLERKDGLRLWRLPAALVACSPDAYNSRPVELRAAFAMLPDAADLLRQLLDGGHSKVAGRLAGALRNIGRGRMADEIIATMRSAGYTCVERDPFTEPSSVTFGARETSPYLGRMRMMWERMREPILRVFPASPGLPRAIAPYLKNVEDLYRSDAYHSLSIEGYQVSAALIERVRSGAWNPDNDEQDRKNRNALAARGYWQAFQAVKGRVEAVLKGAGPGAEADRAHGIWYRELFGPSVTAGILRAADLAGYRNGPVHIRKSMHVPPSRETVRDLMPEFFELLKAEAEPAVRVVLGHFFFVYIHPYYDGNGRVGRFLMNLMLASGGWPWTVISVDTRDEYMAALEQASVHQNIESFARFLAERLANPQEVRAPAR